MNHPLRGTYVGNSIVRLADEGVPIGALSRVFKVPRGEVHAVVKQALIDGVVVGMPASEWPVDSQRGFRSPAVARFRMEDRPDFIMACRRVFDLTAEEARLLQCLMNAPACSHSHLSETIAPEAEPNIIKVLVCKIRRKLRPYQIKIDTIWGQGYTMTEDSKRQVVARIEGKK